MSTTGLQPRIFRLPALSWALFDFAMTVFAMNVMSRFALLWLLHEKGGTDLDMAVAVVVSLVAASVVNLLLAPVSDAHGRRAFYVRVFGLLCVVATAALGMNPPLWGALLLVAIANFANQSAGIFYTAMLPDVSTPRSLGRVSGLGVALGYVGSIIGLFVAERFRGEDMTAAVVFVPTALLYLVMALPQFLFVRDTAPRRQQGRLWRDLAEIAKLVWGDRRLRWFLLAMLLYMDVHGTATIYMAAYASFVFEMGGREKVFLGLTELSLLLIAGTVFAVAGAWVTGLVADRVDKIKLLLGVLGLWCVALSIALLTPWKWPIWVAGPLIGWAMGGVWVLSRALLIELGWPEHRTKLFTVFGLVGRAAGIVGPLLWGITVRVAAPFGTQIKYRAALAVLLVIMLAATWLVKRTMAMPARLGCPQPDLLARR